MPFDFSLIKILVKYIGFSIAFVIILILLYLLCAFILSRIGVSEDKNIVNKTIPCYILTNGVHTDIVIPVFNSIMDWNTFLDYRDCTSIDSTNIYIGFGWGDKGFYLETPTWSDLKASTASKAAFGLSSSAMHVTWFQSELKESESCVKFFVSEEQYKLLVDYIRKSFVEYNGKPVHISAKHAHYGNNDTFYDAQSTYNIFFTCNTWANSALKQSGQKCAFWTPFDSGIFYHYKK